MIGPRFALVKTLCPDHVNLSHIMLGKGDMQVGVGFIVENKVASITFPRLGSHSLYMLILFIRILNDSSICWKKEIFL